MRGKTIVLVSADVELREELANTLACAKNRVIQTSLQMEAIQALDGEDVDLAIIDIAHVQGALGLLDIALTCAPTIAITPGHDLSLLSILVCDMGVTHIMARPEGTSYGAISEILVSAEKILRNDVFGLGKYISGAEAMLFRERMTNSRDTPMQLDRLSTVLRELKAPSHIVSTIANTADEMLTNAMYNAPVDAQGRPRYAATNRRSKIALEPSEQVEFSYGMVGSHFGISVVDQFGRLDHSHLRKSIYRCVHSVDPIEQKNGGAGLGLFLIARSAHQFIMNVAPGERTEVIALWDLDRRKLRQKRAHHSLHYFQRSANEQPEIMRARARGTIAPQPQWPEPRPHLQPKVRHSTRPDTSSDEWECTQTNPGFN